MPEKNKIIEKLKKRYGVKNGFQVLLIMLAFALAGTSLMLTKNFLTEISSFLHINTFGRIMLVKLPAYNIYLLFFGIILGHFNFFWNYEKRFLARLIYPVKFIVNALKKHPNDNYKRP